jgi:SAM-dependent methyltransferase
MKPGDHLSYPKTVGDESDTVDPFYAEDLRQMERAVNYRRWQFGMIERFLGRRVLEVGGGIGNFTDWLAAGGREVVSVEPNGYCFQQLEAKTRHFDNIRRVRCTLESLNETLDPGIRFDSVVMMNVLEHIRDDLGALSALRERLTPDGRMVILVPAGPWAFGRLDERLGHYRRYSRHGAKALFDRAGLRVEFFRYYNFVGLWGWWWNARMGRLEAQNDTQIRFFDDWIVPPLSWLERLIRPPVGQTILIVGRRADKGA